LGRRWGGDFQTPGSHFVPTWGYSNISPIGDKYIIKIEQSQFRGDASDKDKY